MWKGLAAPEEPDSIALRDGHRGRREAKVGAVDRNDGGFVGFLFVGHEIALQGSEKKRHHEQGQGSHVTKSQAKVIKPCLNLYRFLKLERFLELERLGWADLRCERARRSPVFGPRAT